MEIWMCSILAFTAAVALLFTPLTIALARRIGAVDLPDARKIHDHAIPRLGGVAVFSSILLAAGTLLFIQRLGFAGPVPFDAGAERILFPSLLMLCLGIVDDVRSLEAGIKFMAQLGIATICFVLGIRIDAVILPLGSAPFALGWMSYPVTVLWIAGVTNAFNLIDGLDGLASGVGIIASLTITAILIAHGDPGGAIPAVLLAGGLLGFLRYNFNPAKIFLGDSGSLFVGFALAILSVQSSAKGSTAAAMTVPVLALGLPILDTCVAMARRLLGSFAPAASPQVPLLHKLRLMFRPDRRHIHHQLIALGASHRNAVLVLYGVSAALGVSAVLMTVTGSTAALLIVGGASAAAVAGIRRLHYDEMAILKNGMLLPLYDRPLLSRTFFRCCIDVASAALALVCAVILTTNYEEPGGGLLAVPFLACVQVCILVASGLYRTSFRYFGIAEAFTLVRAVGVSVISAALLLLAAPQFSRFVSPALLITDFYLLFSFVGLTRISFRALSDIARRGIKRGSRTLIYGADADGVLMLQQILNDDSLKLQPVGFIDDDPRLEGKNVSGYKVFGGHWNLQRLLQKYEIAQVLISSRTVHPEVLSRMRRIAGELGVGLKQPKVYLTDVPLSAPRVPAVELHAAPPERRDEEAVYEAVSPRRG